MQKRCANCKVNYNFGRYCSRCGQLLTKINSPCRALIVTIVSIAVLFIVSIVLLFANYKGKEENGFEVAYVGIAKDLDMVDLCYKISPNATSLDWFKSTYTQSYCFYTVAVNTHNINLCKQVKSPLLCSDRITRANCEVEVASSKYDHPYTAGSGVKADLILRFLGYNDEDYYTLYLHEREKPEFRAKLATLPDFSTSDGKAKEQIYSIAPECLDSPPDNQLCLQINYGLVRH